MLLQSMTFSKSQIGKFTKTLSGVQLLATIVYAATSTIYESIYMIL